MKLTTFNAQLFLLTKCYTHAIGTFAKNYESNYNQREKMTLMIQQKASFSTSHPSSAAAALYNSAASAAARQYAHLGAASASAAAAAAAAAAVSNNPLLHGFHGTG